MKERERESESFSLVMVCNGKREYGSWSSECEGDEAETGDVVVDRRLVTVVDLLAGRFGLRKIDFGFHLEHYL